MAAPEAMTYISPAHEAMKPFAERPAKDEKQEHGAMVGIPADVLNTYKPPLSDDTPNFYVENKQEKRVNVTQESLTAALEEAAEVQRRANEAYVKSGPRSSRPSRRRSKCHLYLRRRACASIQAA